VGGCGLSSPAKEFFCWSDEHGGYICWHCLNGTSPHQTYVPLEERDTPLGEFYRDYVIGAGNGVSRNGSVSGAFEIELADPAQMRPTEFVWRPWIVRGRLNEMVGEEDIGKSTLCTYIAGALSNGTLPGAFEGQPTNVLFVGADEDAWESDTMPRLRAAGADFAHIYRFREGGNKVFDVERDASELGRLVAGRGFGLIVFEHLVDVLPTMRNYNEPAAMRKALKPVRRMLSDVDVAALVARHVNKTQAQEYRQRAQGSMQFGAMARSSFLVARHPTAGGRRVVVLGKANYVAEAERTALSFEIGSFEFKVDERPFCVGRVVDLRADETTMEDALGGGRPSARERKRDDLWEAVYEGVPSATSLGNGIWHPPPKSGHAIAEAAGRSKTDGSVRRILAEMAKLDFVLYVKGAGWVRPQDNEEEDK
jgi:hypothetical protein